MKEVSKTSECYKLQHGNRNESYLGKSGKVKEESFKRSTSLDNITNPVFLYVRANFK